MPLNSPSTRWYSACQRARSASARLMPARTSASFASAPATLASATSTAASACSRLATACSTAASFCRSFGVELGDRELREHLALLDRVADVDGPVLDVAGDLGVDRVVSNAWSWPGSPTLRRTVCRSGRTTSTRVTGAAVAWPGLPSRGRLAAGCDRQEDRGGREAVDESEMRDRGMVVDSWREISDSVRTWRELATRARRTAIGTEDACGSPLADGRAGGAPRRSSSW